MITSKLEFMAKSAYSLNVIPSCVTHFLLLPSANKALKRGSKSHGTRTQIRYALNLGLELKSADAPFRLRFTRKNNFISCTGLKLNAVSRFEITQGVQGKFGKASRLRSGWSAYGQSKDKIVHRALSPCLQTFAYMLIWSTFLFAFSCFLIPRQHHFSSFCLV
jgi:hypothetical protein